MIRFHSENLVWELHHAIAQRLRDKLLLGLYLFDLGALPYLRTSALIRQYIRGPDTYRVPYLIKAPLLRTDELHASLGAEVDVIAVRASDGSGCAALLAYLGFV